MFCAFACYTSFMFLPVINCIIKERLLCCIFGKCEMFLNVVDRTPVSFYLKKSKKTSTFLANENSFS
jgi:hypothetical protein